MNSLTDQQLLRDYTGRRSEAAFAELVRRHVDLVYSAALRMVCDAHLAEDVTQEVFLALARNAGQLTRHPVLAGWLHRTTQNLAANTVRSDVRRRAREQKAAAMNELLSTEPDAVWEHIAPHLDAALGELSEPDRDALLLRYFEHKSPREMAQTLGTSEDAAQKRVSRAVEHLREFFAKRGVTIGAGGLAVVVSANAVQAAPVGLAVTISTAAVLAGTTVATTTATITKAIAMTTLHKIIVTVTITAAIGTGIFEARQASTLRNRVETIQQQQGSLTEEIQRLQKERDDAVNRASALVHVGQSNREDSSQIAKLRAEMAELQEQAGTMAAALKEAQDFRSRVMQSYSNAPPIRTFVSTASMTVPWGQGIVTGGWKTPSGKRALVLIRPSPGDAQQVMNEATFLEYTEDAGNALGLDQFKTDEPYNSRAQKLSADEFAAIESAARENGGVKVVSAPTILGPSGVQSVIRIDDERQTPAGPYRAGSRLDLVSTISPDSQSVQMVITAQLHYPEKPPGE